MNERWIQPEAFEFEEEAFEGEDEFSAFEASGPFEVLGEFSDETAFEEESGSPQIRWVQQALNRLLGLKLAVDGLMGPMTRSAIRSFQQKSGLTADGIVGPRTEAALVAAGAGTPPAATGGQPGAGGQACPPQAVNVDCPSPGTPTEVLDQFGFDNAALVARHGPRLADLARRIIASQGTRAPIRTVLIAGHTDVVGDENYNFDLGWRRARAALAELCKSLESQRPGVSRSIRFQLTSCGERQPKSTPEQSRRVEIFLPTTGRRPAPDSRCGVPTGAPGREVELEEEIQQRRRVTRARVRAQPRLSLFQNDERRTDRNHFECQAIRQAGRMAAVANPVARDCPRRVGPTPYDTGADIIQALQNARACTGSRLNAVHIFSHSGPHGIAGRVLADRLGLYQDGVDADARARGARTIADVPINVFSENVVIVLHGCRTADGADSFAQALFERLATRLRSPTVFAHPNRGCCGRDNSWREFSRAAPAGRARRSIAPHYSGKGCCT